MDEKAFRDDLLPRLLALDAGPPDPNLVAAWVDGTLPEAERRRLERQLAVDPEAAMLAAALKADRRRARRRRLVLAVAAGLLACVGVGWAVARRGDGAGPGLEARLVAAADRLAAEDPARFAGFRPLAAAELAAPASRRGGAVLLAPVGVGLAPPTEAAWRLPAGATRARVTLEGATPAWSVEVEGGRVALPRCGPGRHVLRVEALDGLGGQPVRGAFVVATEAEAAGHRAALARIDAAGLGDGTDLLAAHYAVRHALYAEARARVARAARAPVAAAAAADLERHLDALAPR